jgi:hypothetical protein
MYSSAASNVFLTDPFRPRTESMAGIEANLRAQVSSNSSGIQVSTWVDPRNRSSTGRFSELYSGIRLRRRCQASASAACKAGATLSSQMWEPCSNTDAARQATRREQFETKWMCCCRGRLDRQRRTELSLSDSLLSAFAQRSRLHHRTTKIGAAKIIRRNRREDLRICKLAQPTIERQQFMASYYLRQRQHSFIALDGVQARNCPRRL